MRKKMLPLFIVSLFFLPLAVQGEMRESSSIDLVPELQGRDFYAEENMISFKGTIKEVLVIEHTEGKPPGVHLKVETEEKDYDVHLGPKWFLDEIGLKAEEGSEVEIYGALVEFNEVEDVIAVTVKVDGKSYSLREDTGYPLWKEAHHIHR